MELLSDRINNCIIINDVITTTSTTTRKSKNCLMKKQKLYLYKRFKMYKTTNDAIGAELSMITTNQLITTPLIPIGEMEELHQYNKLICNECCMPFTINTNQMEYPVNYLCFTTKICMSCNGRIVLVNECPTTRNFIDIPARRQQINCSSKCHCRTMTFYHQIINKEYKLVCNCNISSNSMFSSILTLNQDLNCMCSTTINHCLLNDCNNNNNNNHNNTFKLSPAIKMSTNLQYCGVTHCRTQIQMQTQRQNQTLSSTTTSLSRPISSLLTSIASCTLSSRTKPLPLENVNAHLRMDTALCSRCYFCINATTCKHLKSYRTAAKLTERPPDDQSRMNNILYHINLGIWFFKFVLSNLLWGIITKQTIGNNHKRYRMLRKYHFIKRIYLGHHLYYYHHHHHHHHHHQTNACCFSFMYLRWSNFHINLILMGLWFFTLLSPSTNALTSLEASTNLIGPAETTLIPVKLSRTETVCKSLDIRNSADQLQQLENCTVIEGFLLLTLITTHGPNEFTRSFPLLTEVTEFILIYQINNLRSLAQIFPNLSVIRGRNLFEGYALIVHSNMHLEELGLSKLTTISRGGVRIEKNMMLCYVKTVDWSQIVSNTTDIIIEENREPIECPPCPGDQRNSPIDLVCKEHLGRRNCWNGSTCQKICPERCRHNCLNETTCCNESCLGGCSPNNTHECVICRHFSINNDTCIDKCPDNGYSYLDRRCLTAEACMELRYKYQDGKPQKLVPYDGRCTTRCPEGYNKENSTCVKCGDKCKKVCVGGLIDSVARAKEFHGCTNITGEGLSIAIKRGSRHLIEDLEYGLGSIEVISTYLKVQGTIGMLNLHFLKKLQKIEGKTLLEDRYALYVLENSDMESVWAYNQTVRIGKGTVYFHFNPKLCLAEIEKLLPMLKNQTKFDKNEVSEDSNGSRGTCNTAFLNVTTSRVQSQVAIIDILNPMQFEDNRTFIGYQYLYIQDDYGNATKHGYRPCDDGWIASLPTKETRYILYNLKPYTQYAYYVKTMTISTERRNAQSPIQHFKTRSGQPKFVRMLEAYSNSSSEIIINWQPPITANGKLIKYKIRAVYLKDIQGFETRNYCKNPLKEIAKAENPKIDHPKTEKPLSLDDCKCQATKDPFYDDENAEANIHASIEFENSLQNFVYIKKQGNTTTSTNELSNYERSKRSIEEKIFDSFLMRQTREISTDTTSLNDVNGIESNDNLNDAIYREVNASTTEFVFTNLKHFSWYLIGVEACRQPEKYPSSKNKSKKNESEKECSMEVKTQVRTLMLDDVDKVENFRAVLERTNSSRSNIVLYWNRPSTPNGAVVSYTISYELQTQDAVEEKKCITEADYTALNYQRHGYVLSGLLSGNYSIRVRANSLAGEGKYSKTIYIYIPPTTPSPSLISGIVLATLLLLALLIIVVYIVYHKKYRKEPTDVKIFPIVNPYYVSLQYVPDEWEVARDRIIQLNSLGQGSFGMVYEGILRGAENSEEDIPCAIKTVNENATERERLNFLNEASVMKQFNTYHVVHLLGVCSRGQPALVIMELMKNGDLKSYLRAHRPDERSATDLILADRPTPPSLSRIYQMAIEIADGMAYLAAKKFVHRDLAARNCMVAADLTVKIGDFGMTRDIYETDYYRKGSKGLLPVRWMPPESLRDGVYSTASDVFSYGVVLWEMTTLASQPYQGLSNDQVLRYVIEGGVMERPENCPDILYNLMQKCWHHRPTARPTFMDIIRYLENMAEPYFRKVSFYHSDEGQHTMAKEFAERCKRSGDVYDLDEEYNRYNFHIDNNSSIEGKDENLMIMETEQQHSSLGLAITPSSTPDETVKHNFALSQNIISEQILHSAPSTSSGLVKDKRYVQTKSRRHSQVRMQQADDVDAYILPDCENSNCIDLKANDVNEQGYELYDPSPNYSEVGTTGKGSSIHTGGDDFDMKSPVVGDASHLMAMRHQPITIPNIMPCSSSMSDEIINQMAASSLHPSTASAASSTASSRATTTGRFKAVADSLKPVRMRVKNMRFFNQKRSSSNASDNSNTFILKNVSGGSDDLIASGENGANGDNTTNRNDAVGSLIGQNLSTIESGGSGSAGSYSTTPRFFTTTAGSGAVGSCGGDQRNYRRLNESSAHSAQEDSRKSGEKIKSELPSAVSAFTISTNPNYQKLEESFNTSLEETTTTMASIIQIRTLRNPSENTNYQPLDVSDNANYVVYDPEQKKEQHRQQQRPDVDSSGTVQMELSDNPNYKLMGPAPICTTTTYTIPTMTTVATPPPRAIHLERSGGLHTKRDRFNKFSGTPSTSSSSEHSTEEEEDEEDYEADEGIKMDRMPLRRRNRNNPAHRKCGGSSRDHSRSRSSSSHSHVTTPINTPTSVSVSANLSNVTPSMAAYKNTIMTTPLPVPPTSTATFSLKEKWLKQQQQHQQQQQQQNQQQHQSSPPPQSQPPPNGFVGREV